MWNATRVSADFFNNVQKEAGILLKTFDASNPVEPADEDIITATTGGITVTCVPETQDLFEDIDNVPGGTMEGLDITRWNVGLSTTAIGIDEDTIVFSLGAAEINENGGVSPRRNYKLEDFKTITWIGDMTDPKKLLCAIIKNAVSTGGFSLQTGKNAKGQLALEISGHPSLKNQEEIPAEFYILEKVEE